MSGHDTYSHAQHYRLCMARLARIVIPEPPHPVTQCGNLRTSIFFQDGIGMVFTWRVVQL